MARWKCAFIVLTIILLGNEIVAQSPVSGGSANDCFNSILICGNAAIGITPSGVGFNEFSDPDNPEPECLEFSRFDQAWFRVEIETDGMFTFEINPDDGVADYDFAVFGPTSDCGNLGASIRCSSTNPQAAGVSAATGLNETETDLSEGPGQLGNGFLRQLDVAAGETYYIVVALAVGAGGFTLNTGGTTEFPDAAVANDVSDLQECDDDDGSRDGFKEFDFTSRDVEILNGQPNAVVSYHTSLNDANLGDNPITFPFTNTENPQEIFYRVRRTDSDCADFNSFLLTIDDSRIDTDVEPIFICSENASEIFDFSTIIDDLVTDSSMFDITYHNTFDDAVDEVNNQPSTFVVTSMEQIVYIKIIDPTGALCDSILNVPLTLDNPPAIATPNDLEICDDDFDTIVTTDVSVQDAMILDGLDPSDHTVSYFETTANRDLNENQLTNRFTNVENPQLIFARVTNQTSGCTADTQFELVVRPRPVLAPQESPTICIDGTDVLTLTVESGFAFYDWSDGTSGTMANSIEVMTAGDFTVVVTNNFGCESSLTITVEPSEIAQLERIDITDFQNGNNAVTIVVTGTGDYEYAVDNDFFQDSPDFTGLSSGFHTLFVRDKNGCGILEREFGILDFQPFFTPNFDGFNDTWTLDALSEFPEARLLIYDRYGKLLKQILPSSIGWDGTFNGEPLPSSTYWFTVEIPDRPIVRGFFALKR